MPPEPRILQADRPRALRATLLVAATQVPLLAVFSWLALTPDFGCETLFGVNGGVIAMLAVSYLLPLSMTALSLPFIRLGLAARAQGAFPPRSTAVWHDMRIVDGRQAQLRAWTLIALAPACALLVVFGAKIWSYYGNGRSVAQLEEAFTSTCATQTTKNPAKAGLSADH